MTRSDAAGDAQPATSRGPGTADPSVSILIPVYNRVDLTKACLESLASHADPAISTETIVIDDCSTDGTAVYLASLGDSVRIFRNAVRGSFALNINAAAQLARGDYLLLLNNDTEVTPGWLRAMLEPIRRDPTIGIVGNLQLFPGTREINHAGMVFNEQRWPVHLHIHKPAEFAPAVTGREFQAVTGACLLIRRALFDELGGFDAAFKNGYEDVDLCLRARERGLKVWYAGDSVIYHHMAASEGRHDHERENERLFAEKWRDRVVPDRQAFLIGDGEASAAAEPPVSSAAVPAAAT